MKPSTKEILRRHGLRLDRALHNWGYFVFYRPYVKAALTFSRLAEKRFAGFPPVKWISKMVFERYHSKVLSRSDVTKIIMLERDLHLGPDQHKRIIPYKFANSVVFRQPHMIAVMDCPCVTASKASCDPGGKCMAVGADFAPLWLEHCKHLNARLVTREEALANIEKYRKTGHIQQAFLKVSTGGITGVICNCCPKCCVSLEASRIAQKTDKTISMNAESGYSVRRDGKACTACGSCAAACPFSAMQENGQAPPSYQSDLCMGCGLCVDVCSQAAIELFADPDKLLPLDLDLLRGGLSKK
ncbi:MAG: 4Fe-4S binding protein [Thermodesulfobacteriota bacterium]